MRYNAKRAADPRAPLTSYQDVTLTMADPSIPDNAPLRQCRTCGQYKPKTREFWPWRTDGVDKPARRLCEDCWKAKERERGRKRRQRPEYQAYQREHRKRPDARARARKRRQNPAYKARDRAYQREYQRSPEYKAQRRQYRQRPEVQAHLHEYFRNHNARSDRQARMREYHRKSYRRQVRARRRAMWESLPVAERGAALREVLAQHRWEALRDRMPHVVYRYVFADGAQYVGMTRAARFHERMAQHLSDVKSACQTHLAAGDMPLVEVLHRCPDRASALALERAAIVTARHAGALLLNIK